MEISAWGESPRVCAIDVQYSNGGEMRIAAVKFKGMEPLIFRIEKITEDEGKIHMLMLDGRWEVPPGNLRHMLVSAGIFDFWKTNMSSELEDELGDIIKNME